MQPTELAGIPSAEKWREQQDQISVLTEALQHQQRTLESVRAAEHLSYTILDALPAHIALLQSDATIIYTNVRWVAFGRSNGDSRMERCGVGTNYLQVCRAVSGKDGAEASEAAEGVSGVLAGTQEYFEMEYPCDSPEEARWFHMAASPVLLNGHRHALVVHTNMTARRQSEQAAFAAQVTSARQETHDREVQALATMSSRPHLSATASLYGRASLRESMPTIFNQLVQRYAHLLDRALEQQVYRVEEDVSEDLRTMGDELGFLKVGPRDVVEIHTWALRSLATLAAESKAVAYMEEGRLRLLELIGYLASYYQRFALGTRLVLPRESVVKDTLLNSKTREDVVE